MLVRGRHAPVHKPLLSAAELTRKNDVYLFGDGGWAVSHRSKVADELRAALEAAVAKHGYDGCMSIYKEKNVYNMYMKMGSSSSARGGAGRQAVDLCAQGAEGTPAGGLRPGPSP